MRPDPSRALMGSGQALLMELAPDVRTPFGQHLATYAAAINIVLAQEFDRMVDRLHQENEAVAAILLDAAPLLADRELAARAVAAADGRQAANLRVSTFQAINDRLRSVLIEVHAAIEETPGDAAREMDDRIWAEYALSTQRRHVETFR